MSSTTDNEQRFAYLLSPEFQIVNTAGKPLTGGWIEVYIHGTRVKYYCFSDFDGTLHPFQIPLDSLGSNIVLASPTHAYDIYIYNKFGALVMSRYNVVPACNAADIVEDVVVIDSPNETLNVTCDGGSNWHLEVNTDLIATTDQLATVSGDLQDQIDNKKDLQLPYAATGTVTKTITKIEQNENGEIEVTYSDIDLPPQVPNIDIISPSGTIDVSSTVNPSTNTKTFKIDIHKTKMDFFDGYCGHSRDEYRTGSDIAYFTLYVDEWDEYKYQGDFIANNWQEENNTNFILNSGLYLITATIRYQMNSNHNQEEYIRIYTGAFNGLENGTRYKDWSNEVALSEDTAESSIQVSFIRNVEDDDDYLYMNGNHSLYFKPELPAGIRNAFIDHLQIVKLDSIAAFNGGSGPRYIPGYGIEILDDVIQVATGTVVTNNYFNTVVSSINNEINEINTTIQNVTGDITELSETVTNIVGATGDFVNRDEFNAVTGDIVNINEAITNIIGATGDYATTDYVDAAVSGLENYSAGQYVSIEDHVINVTGLQPEGDYATNEDLQIVSGAIPESEAVEFEELDLAQFAQASAVTVIQNQINNVTGDINNINEAITNIIGATGDYATEEYVDEAIAAVTGQPLEQQQSDWTQSDDTKVDYIKHKPREVNLIPGDHIVIEQQDLDVIISATGIGDVYNAGQFISIQNGTISATGVQPAGNYATEQYVDEAVAAVTGQPFEQVNSDWLATSGVQEILNKPDVFQLIAGDNIDITPSGNDLVISASSDVTKAYVDEQIAIATGMIPEDTVTHTELDDAIDTVTGMIPEAQVNADWLATSGKAEILNKPQEETVEFEEINLSDYALASAIPSLEGYATEQYVDTAVAAATGMIPSDVVTEEELNTAIDTVTGMIPEAQVNADWNATSGKAEILNKPETEDVEFEEVDLSIYALASAVPDVIQLEIDVANLAAATGDYLQSSDLNGYATEQYVDNAIEAVTGLIPDVSNLATNADLQTVSGAVDAVSGAIPESEEVEFEELDLSIYATNVDLQIVSGAIPSDVVTHAELNDAIDTVTGLIPEEQVNADWTATSGKAEILNKPETEEVQFEEIDLSDFASASVVNQIETDVANLVAATGNYLTEQVNADWEANSGAAEILNKPVEYELVAGDNINIVASGGNVIISSTGGGAGDVTMQDLATVSGTLEADIQTVSAAIPDTSIYATETDLQTVSAAIPESEEVQFEELDLTDYALASAIPDISNINTAITNLVAATGDYLQSSDLNGYATEAYVDAAITGTTFEQVNADWNATSGVAEILNKPSVVDVTVGNLIAGDNISITASGDDIVIAVTGSGSFTQVNSDWNATSGVAEILNKPQEEEVQFEEVDLSDYAPVSAIPSLAGYATETYVNAAVSGKQDVLTGITDVQVVNSLPASPVATVLYLIKES